MVVIGPCLRLQPPRNMNRMILGGTKNSSRWAPTIVMNGVIPAINNLMNKVTGVTTPMNGAITLLIITVVGAHLAVSLPVKSS